MSMNGKTSKTADAIATPATAEDNRLRPNQITSRVLLSGQSVVNCYRTDTGHWAIVLKASYLTIEDQGAISRLFPHLAEQAYSLLEKEALIAAMVRHE